MSTKYELIRQARGRTEVIDDGPLPKMRDRLRELRSSTRGGRVSGRTHNKYTVVYSIRPETP